MKNFYLLLGIFFFISFTCFSIPKSETFLKGKTIYITDDEKEWPPYIFYKRDNKLKTNTLMGFSCDVISEIFLRNKINYNIKLLPWKRAQHEVELGNKYSMFLNASYNEERASKYYISEPYYSTSAYYFYSKKIYPKGLPIYKKSDLLKYRITGLLGHNYKDYVSNNKSVYMNSGDYESLSKQLHAGYYDIFLESLEIITGWAAINTNILEDKSIGYAKVPEMDSVNFYMMFSKNKTGAELKRIIDEEIKDMTQSGKLKELLKKYIRE